MVDVPAPQVRSRQQAAGDASWRSRLVDKVQSLVRSGYECGCHVRTDQGYELVYDPEARLEADSDLPPPGREVWVRRGL